MKKIVHMSDLFTYNADSKTFVTEVTDLKGKMADQIYPDACDYGFYIQSVKTGIQKLFTLDSQTVCDGELICHKFTNDEGFKAIVYND